MADEPQNTALQDSEQDDNTGDFSAFGIGGDTQTPPAPQSAPQATPSATAATPPIQVDTKQKVHPHMALLAGLLGRVLTGVRNAPGNPNNALDRGFMAASPNNQAMQQAAVSKAQSEADLAKMQVSITGMKALQYEYLLKRMPQEEQQKHLDAISQFKQNLIKEGANVEAEGDDEKASDAQATHMNATDPRATGHAGRFYSLPTMDASGKAKFDVVYVPSKDTLQSDFKWTDPDGNEQTIPAGTPMSGALGKFVEAQQKGAQGQAKAEHKAMADALGPVTDEKASGVADWLESQQKQNTPLYQQNKAAVDQQITTLRGAHQRAQQEKLQQARAGAEVRTEAKQSGAKAGNYYHWVGSDGETHVGKGNEVPEGVEATPIGGEKEFAQYTAEAHISNIVQQSLNRVHQDIDEHPELFDNSTARNILATTLEQIDRASAGILVAGTGGSVPLPSGMGAMINTALQNKALNRTTADAVKQYIADYKAMKDKAISMQMEMQGGKIGRGAAQMFKSITDQIPNGETADSRTAHRQMEDLQQTQDELSKKYGNYGDFKKIAPYKPLDRGESSTSKQTEAEREAKFENRGQHGGLRKVFEKQLQATQDAIKSIGEAEMKLAGKKPKDEE